MMVNKHFIKHDMKFWMLYFIAAVIVAKLAGVIL